MIVGLTIDPQRIVSTIRAVRRHGLLNEFVSVSTNAAQRSVYIASDGGRLCRPYIVVKDSIPQVTQEHIEVIIVKNDWVNRGFILFQQKQAGYASSRN